MRFSGIFNENNAKIITINGTYLMPTMGITSKILLDKDGILVFIPFGGIYYMTGTITTKQKNQIPLNQ